VTLRRAAVPALRALLLALASVVIAAPAHASLPALGDRARASDELHARTSALGADLPRELPTELPKECNGPFCVPPLETRVGGFDLRLSCSVGGEDVLTCGSRLAYGLAYGGRAVERSVFTGHVFDTETGLYLAKARFLDPKLGRFITQDSNLGQIDRPPSLHRYLYASDNPTTRIDLTGYDDADANALAKAMSTSSAGWMASDHRPAYQKSWTRNYLETLYVEVPIRAMPGQAKMFEGMARQDAKEFASGAGEAVAVAATPLVVKEGGGALLDRVPALGRFLRKDLGELASSAVSKGKAALEGATSRLKGLFGEPPAGGNSLVPATGVQPPPAPEAVPGLNTGPFEVPPAASAPKKVPHKATLAVLDPEGNPILTENLVSGGSGKPKPTWPEQGAVHTEGKGTTRVRELLDSGVAVDEAAFSGQLRPCPMCKGNMNKLHRETGVPSTYVDQTGAVWRSTNAPPRPRAPRPAPAPMPAPTPAVPERPLE
jgi:RHS repeat-associated protein